MSDRNLPDIRPGKSLLGIPASEWQTLIRDVRALRNLSAGPGIKVIKNDAGIIVSALPQAKTGGSSAIDVAIKTVIITEPVADDATSLTVQEVVYKDDPPKPPTSTTPENAPSYYETVGEEFKAYPYLGKKATDYKDYVTSSSSGGTLDVFDARLIAKDVYMLSAPNVAKAEIRIGKIVSTTQQSGQGGNFLQVQPVRTKFADDGTRQVLPDGELEYVLTWPGLLAGDFSLLRNDAIYVLLVGSGGNWFAAQTIPWSVFGGPENASVAQDNCT